MMPSWRVPHLRRGPLKDKPRHPSQWRPRWPLTEEPIEELAPAEVSTKKATPTKEPNEELTPAEISMGEASLIEEPTEETTPAVASTEEAAPMEEPSEELTTPTAMASG